MPPNTRMTQKVLNHCGHVSRSPMSMSCSSERLNAMIASSSARLLVVPAGAAAGVVDLQGECAHPGAAVLDHVDHVERGTVKPLGVLEAAHQRRHAAVGLGATLDHHGVVALLDAGEVDALRQPVH